MKQNNVSQTILWLSVPSAKSPLYRGSFREDQGSFSRVAVGMLMATAQQAQARKERNDNMKHRPTEHSIDVLVLSVEKLAPFIIAYLNRGTGGLQLDESEHDTIKESLTSALMYDDTYEMCRSLESDGWVVDGELFHEMERAHSIRYKALQEQIRKWVHDENVKVNTKVGDLVSFKYRNDYHLGEVVAIDAERATCHVYCEELGHVKQGIGPHALVLPAENLIVPARDQEIA